MKQKARGQVSRGGNIFLRVPPNADPGEQRRDDSGQSDGLGQIVWEKDFERRKSEREKETNTVKDRLHTDTPKRTE